ncbi:cytosolic carboxypeptidase-like protein 5 [Schistocerca piceifrons]|uniref:cytosolic carboxypeptidase-like protein 5 n=1 Tax=Schistocerca piceifrons TaxID=274613 RepID=UPI001F5F3E2A|nr:cytosolic carboxypeptidase-like protein 5 [Schistocerca piceifrons]
MDVECGGFTFLSNFDSGNLARVELVPQKFHGNAAHTKNSSGDEVPDFEFNIWTRPDCYGTEFENSNRTWFYFGIKGGAPFAVVKLNIVNLNKQSKMYSQGMAPVYRIVPGRNSWDRIKEKPTFVIEDNTFILSFKYRTLENLRSITYFAFTYPYSYTDLQNMLCSLDTKFKLSEESTPKLNLDDIYYHRECVCYSLERRRIDLITISSYHNISLEREPRLRHLFPEINVPRPFKFLEKKVVFISARVHPGETPSSFVLNGLLSLLLNRDDPVSILLRKTFVFKLVPILNPDGVARGHYRTDTRGVNLNRVYLNPSLTLHPSIFAARALIRYYHFGQEIEEALSDAPVASVWSCANSSSSDTILHDEPNDEPLSSSPEDRTDASEDQNRVCTIESQVSGLSLYEKENETVNNAPIDSNVISSVKAVSGNLETSFTSADNNVFSAVCETIFKSVASVCDGISKGYTATSVAPNMTCNQNFSDTSSSVDETNTAGALSNLFIQQKNFVAAASTNGVSCSGVSVTVSKCSPYTPSVAACDVFCSDDTENGASNTVSFVGIEKNFNPEDSGLFLYIDLHGHASKKGIFMYGNHFNNIEDSIECMLLPKIMSLNNQNFHFTACNFTERNMYLRDRRDGMSREGSGRVAVLKITGLVRSYTLECNYNTGRLVNILPSCSRDNTKSPPAHVIPPKYTPHIFEEVGRALGVSILDLSGQNPWSRIPNSEFRSLTGIRDWLRAHCIPEQAHGHKMSRAQRQARNSQPISQVAAASRSPLRPSSSDTALKSIPRVRRLAPLPAKATSKLNGNCPQGIAEERKENVSGFPVGTSRTVSDVRTGRSFQSSRTPASPCSLQRCHLTGTKRVRGTPGAAGTCVFKQILSVKTKCVSVATVAANSKNGKNMVNGRILGNVGNGKRSEQNVSTSYSHSSKTRVPSSKNSHENRFGFQGADIQKDKVLLKQVSRGSGITVGRIVTPNRIKIIKDDHKALCDQHIVKQGSKRLKISPVKGDHSIFHAASQVDNGSVSIGNLSCKDVLSLNADTDISMLRGFNTLDEIPKFSKDVNYSECNRDKLHCNSLLKEDTDNSCCHLSQARKQKPLTKLANTVVHSCKHEGDNVTGTSKDKYSTRLDKQAKSKTTHLSPVKVLKKSPSFGKKLNTDVTKKRVKVSVKSLTTVAAKLKKSFSGELAIDKKRKKSKPNKL